MNWIDYEVEKPADGQVVAIFTEEGVGSGKYEAAFRNFTQILMPGEVTFRQFQVSHWFSLPDRHGMDKNNARS